MLVVLCGCCEICLILQWQLFADAGTAPDPGQAQPGDRFDENREELDHVSLSAEIVLR